MVSVGDSSLGRTFIRFVQPGVKINGQYYRDVLLMGDLLPEILDIRGILHFPALYTCKPHNI